MANFLCFQFPLDDSLPQTICSTCDVQVEDAKMLLGRIKTSIPLWKRYLADINKDPVKEEVSIGTSYHFPTDVLLNCHLCGKLYNQSDLLEHIKWQHGSDHVQECVLCRALLATPTLTERLVLQKRFIIIFIIGFPCTFSSPRVASPSALSPFKDDSSQGGAYAEVLEAEEETNESQEETMDQSDDDGDGTEEAETSPTTNDRKSCEFCDKTYASMDKLRAHKRATHKIHPLACLTCYVRFKSRQELNSHIQSRHRKSTSKKMSNFHRPFNCNFCAMSFVYENKLKKHLLLHPEANEKGDLPTGMYSCNLCSQEFARATIRDQHMLRSHVNAFLCTHCDPEVSFASPTDLRAHEAEVHTFKCDQCSRTLRTEELYKQHLHEHKMELHDCRFCGKGFQTMELLDEHRKKVHQRQHRCPVCHGMFDKVETLNEHVAVDHEKISCYTCHAEFPTLKGLKLHEMMHKSPEELSVVKEEEKELHDKELLLIKRPFPCEKCRDSFRSQKKLDSHMADRHDEKGYHCGQCKKEFESKAKLRQHSYKHNMKLCGICGLSVSTSLNTHMRRHANDKPFKCLVEGCGKQFPRNYDLMVHTKTHTGEKPFPCEFPSCTMRFSRKNKVTVHMRTHSGEKPYKCTIPDCNRQFAQSFDLTLHLRRHTGEKPYECTRCGERFILTSLLKVHQVNCSGSR